MSGIRWLSIGCLLYLAALPHLPFRAAETIVTYPLWDGVESIESYAKRVDIPSTRTLDLGHGVKLALVLIPAGKFEMGIVEPAKPSITELNAKILVFIGSGMAVVLLLTLIGTYRQRKFSFSLRWLMMMTLASGLIVGGFARWRLARQEESRYIAALALYTVDVADDMHTHPVTIETPFYMGKYPLTQEEYEAIIGHNPSLFKGLRNPVERVTWYNAVQYCRDLSGQLKKAGQNATVQLPTETQWEYACKAGTQTRFYTGNSERDLDDAAWYENNSNKTTHPVGQKKPNAFGLYDMHGNVWQYCTDLYDPSANVEEHTVRGGCWQSDPQHCRAAYRGAFDSSQLSSDAGIRVVLPVR